MNLLPIIYSSLTIFTAFVVFVVIISYITYKIKEKKRVNHHTARIDFTANYIDRAPLRNKQNHQTQYSYSQVPVKKSESKRKVNYYTNELSASYNTNPSRLQATRQTIVRPKNNRNDYVPNIDFPERHRTTQINNQNRFAILNNQPSMLTGSASFRNQEFNVLNYYANDEEIHSTKSYAKVS